MSKHLSTEGSKKKKKPQAEPDSGRAAICWDQLGCWEGRRWKKEHKQTTNNMTLNTWQVVRASNCRSETHSTALHHRYLQEGKGSKDREDKAQTRVTRKHKCMRSEREERRGERCLMHYGRSLSRLKQNIYRMDQDCIC